MAGVQNRDILQQLQHHYFGNGHRRWNRLTSLPYWLYIDLFSILTRWDKVWDIVRGVVSQRERELQGHVKAPPILRQARALHQDIATNITLREHIRVHKASFVEFGLGIYELNNLNRPISLLQRTRLISKALEHYEKVAETNLEQLQNLLSLAYMFNIETVAQGYNVSRLNIFAFIFLTLSFVASVFAITTMTAPPQWYPVAAVGILVLTGLVVFITTKAQALSEGKTYSSSGARLKHKTYPSKYDLMDVEKSDTSHISIRERASMPGQRPPSSDETSTNNSSSSSNLPPTIKITQPAPPKAVSRSRELPAPTNLARAESLVPIVHILPVVRRVSGSARESRSHSRDVDYFVASRPLTDKQREDEHRRRLEAGTGEGDESSRDSQYSFLMRRSLASDVSVRRKNVHVRRYSPTRFRSLDLNETRRY